MSHLHDVHCMYEKIEIGRNDICKNCKPKNKNPLAIWQVGSKFANDKHKIFFIGKTGRGDWGEVNKSGFVYATATDAKNRFLKSSYHYWKYTRDIASKLYGSPEESWDRIAFSNIIKCTDTDTVDKTENSVKNNCILKLGVIKNEIEILKPKNIIFYTGNNYDEYITTLIDGLKRKFNGKEILSQSGCVTSRPKKGKMRKGNDLKFHTKELVGTNGRTIMRFLITSHPERQNKERFINKITEWVLEGESKKF